MIDFTDTTNVNDEWMFNDKEDETMVYNYNGEKYECIDILKEQIREDIEDRINNDDLDEFIDEGNEVINIGYLTYTPSQVLRSVDPIAYSMYRDDYIEYILDTVYDELDYMDIDESIECCGIEVNTYVSWEV